MNSAPKQARGRATRTDILRVARRLFSEHGYHNTGIADIQAATGLTKGAFYHHFRNKEELALAVLEAARADYAEGLFAPAMTRESAGACLEALLEGIVALNRRPEWCNCQMMVTLCTELTLSDQRLGDAVREMQRSFFETLRDVIGQAQRSGEADDKISAEMWAQWIMNTLAGSLVAKKIGSTQVKGDDLLTMMKAVLVGKSATNTEPQGNGPAGHRRKA